MKEAAYDMIVTVRDITPPIIINACEALNNPDYHKKLQDQGYDFTGLENLLLANLCDLNQLNVMLVDAKVTWNVIDGYNETDISNIKII